MYMHQVPGPVPPFPKGWDTPNGKEEIGHFVLSAQGSECSCFCIAMHAFTHFPPYVYACIHMYTYVCICMHMHAAAYVCRCIHMYAYAYTWMHVHN